MRALTWIPLLVVLGACDRPGPSTDSKSNWLRECTTDRECADSLSCICGVCTMACTGAAACDRSGADAACVDAAEAALRVEGRRSDVNTKRTRRCIGDDVGEVHPAGG